jgi:hypothetical protein
MKRAHLFAGLFAITGSLAVACGNDFDPKSAITGIRVLGVKVETPYAKPGTTTKLSMLLVDGSSDRVVRQPKVVWFHGCKNPKGDSFLQCYPDMSRRLGEAYGGKVTVIDKEIPGLVTLGTDAVADVPADTLTSRPPAQQGSFPQGRLFVFFVACGGNVTYDPNPPNSSGLPVRCVNPQTNEDLDAQEFVYGYTPIFVFDQLTNQNPTIEGSTFGGAPPTTKTCAEGCPVGHACSGTRCLPVVAQCTTDKDTDCPTVDWKPLVARSSVEIDAVATKLDGEETTEELWVEYAAINGRFESGSRLVNDPKNGWRDDSEGKFMTFKSAPGEATLYAVVRDNRGGQAWTSFDVIVQ